jgi:CDP-diacylglycerol--glycerol-3-phosphate 3-phosphatidyltransferase
MNLPNKLTVSRFALTVAFLAVLFSSLPARETWALALFSLASLTDYFDGEIARRRKLVTNFGILMDPLADKILICSTFIAFIELHWMEAWMVIVIVARELAITGLRLLAASKNQVLAAEGYGKHKTISQIVAIIAILVYSSYEEWGALGHVLFGFEIYGKPWIVWFMPFSRWAAVILTAYSGGLYLWRNRALYLNDC